MHLILANQRLLLGARLCFLWLKATVPSGKAIPNIFLTRQSHDALADVPVELPKFDVTWLAIDDSYKLMHVKVMSPAELGLGPDVQVITDGITWLCQAHVPLCACTRVDAASRGNPIQSGRMAALLSMPSALSAECPAI